MEEDFYIFLDFDGVLNDFSTIPSLINFVKKDNFSFNRESIEALNSLIKTLENKYSVHLVLSTFWRRNLTKSSELLLNNGLEYKGTIEATPIISHKSRLFEIIKFIQEKKLSNYVVIDDIPSITKYFAEKNNIKTNIISGALTISSILNYIDSYYPDLSPCFPFYQFEFEKTTSC